MKLIGALLVRRMLAGKVFLAILAELVHAPTQEAMESAAALLTVAGGFFDTRDLEWTHHACLDDMFSQLRSVAGRPSCSARTRCLLTGRPRPAGRRLGGPPAVAGGGPVDAEGGQRPAGRGPRFGPPVEQAGPKAPGAWPPPSRTAHSA
ncbi:unnamed protein product [Prorocentrum cordatum]|uniref:Uncharacterized protein n=1 Tax=Prorocentrum cordatum TaxID=2364126 RepID=A0ABN9RJX8_9DINO|nr:unnamed protein product [Polarella glacialis]